MKIFYSMVSNVCPLAVGRDSRICIILEIIKLFINAIFSNGVICIPLQAECSLYNFCYLCYYQICFPFFSIICNTHIYKLVCPH